MFLHEKEVLYEEYENDKVIGCTDIHHEDFVSCDGCAISKTCPARDKSPDELKGDTSIQDSIVKNVEWLLVNDPKKIWKSKITEILGRY